MNRANILNEYEKCLQCPTEILGFLDELYQNILLEKTRTAKNDEILYLFDKLFEPYDIENAKGKLAQIVNMSKANKLTFNKIENKYGFVAKIIDKVKHNISLYENEWPGIYEWSQKVQMNNKKQLFLHVPISLYKQGDPVCFSHEVSSFNNKNVLYMNGEGRIVYNDHEPVFGVIRVNKLPNDTHIRVVNHTEGDINALTVNKNMISMLFKKNSILSFTWGGLCHEKNLKENLYISCIISISL
jgi:hypothetical protein